MRITSAIMDGSSGLELTDNYRRTFKDVLLQTYFAGWDAEYLASELVDADVEAHVSRRMLEFETIMLPWVREVFDLRGARVLEIGCGTGSATVPVARATAFVDAYDVSEPSLEAARTRAALLGVTNVRCHRLEPTWAQQADCAGGLFGDQAPVDMLLLVALLE